MGSAACFCRRHFDTHMACRQKSLPHLSLQMASTASCSRAAGCQNSVHRLAVLYATHKGLYSGLMRTVCMSETCLQPQNSTIQYIWKICSYKYKYRYILQYNIISYNIYNSQTEQGAWLVITDVDYLRSDLHHHTTHASREVIKEA